jgi:hypothetical protein
MFLKLAETFRPQFNQEWKIAWPEAPILFVFRSNSRFSR